MIVAEQSIKELPPHPSTCWAINGSLPCDQLIVEPLMIAFRMIMCQILVQHIMERSFTQQKHLTKRCRVDGTHKPFTVGVEMRRLRR